MPSRLDRAFLYELYRKYGGELGALTPCVADRDCFGIAYHKEEGRILYMMVRHFQPELIVEFSPKHGLTTAIAALALETNGHGRILSFELGHRRLRRAYENLKTLSLTHRVRFVLGDVREELPKAAPTGGLEFLFIDCDHSGHFARWYLTALFPSVRCDGIVHVHDVHTEPLAPRASLPLPPTGEELEIRRFLAGCRGAYEWISIGDCVHDPAYLDAVRPFGGGGVALEPGATLADMRVDREWNPSLWLRKRASQESEGPIDVPFDRIRRSPFKALGFRWRQRKAAALQRP